MNKKSKQLVSGAAIALAIAGVGSNVHADETQASTATPAPEAQAQTQETVETAKAAADTAQATATHAQEAVTAQQANVDAAQTVVNTAQADATAADKAYEQAYYDELQADLPTIAQQQSTVNTAEKAVEAAQNAVPDATTAHQLAQDAVQTETAEQQQTKEAVDVAEANAKAAQEGVDKAQAIVDGTSVEKAQADVTKAEQDVNTANQQVNDATVKVAQAEQQDKERQAKITDAKANLDKVATADTKQAAKDSSDAEAEAKAAQAEATKQAALQTAAEQEAKAAQAKADALKANAETVVPAKVTLPQGYDLEKDTETLKINATASRYAFDSYKNASESDRKTIVDVAHMTTDQVRELSEYGAQIINDIRRQYNKLNGFDINQDLLAVTDESVALTLRAAKNYAADKWYAFEPGNGWNGLKAHDTAALMRSSTAFSKFVSEAMSDLSLHSYYHKVDGNAIEYIDDSVFTDLKESETTMAILKEDIFYGIQNIILSPLELEHADILISTSDSIGVIVSWVYSDYEGQYSPQLHFITSAYNGPDKDKVYNNDYANTFEKAAAKDPKQAQIAALETQAKSATERAKTAEAAKVKADVTYKTALTKKAQADAILTNAAKALKDAQAVYNAALATSEATPNANRTLIAAKANLAKAETVLKSAKEALNTVNASKAEKEQALKDAKAKLAEKVVAWSQAKEANAAQERRLAQAIQREHDAKAAVQTATDNVTKAQTALKDAKAYLERLQNAKANLKTATAAKDTADKALADAKAKLDTENAKLTDLKATADKAQADYQTAKAHYDAVVEAKAQMDKLKNDYVIKTDKDGTVTAVPKTAPTADEKPVYVLTPDDIAKGEKKVDKTIEDLNAINKEITDNEAALKDAQANLQENFNDPQANYRLHEEITALNKKLEDAKIAKDKAEKAVIEAPITADTDKEAKRDTLTVIKNDAEQVIKDADAKTAELKAWLPKQEEILRNTPEKDQLIRAKVEFAIENIKNELKQLESTKANAEAKKNGAIKALIALDKPVTPDTPSETPSDKPSETKPVTPNKKPSATDNTKPSQSVAPSTVDSTQTVDAKTTANGQVSVQAIQAAYNKVTTQKETDKVLDRRGVPTYKAATALPTTGDKESTTFAILGMTVLSLGAIGMKKRKI
ncbi:SEC10/PgrA surface exclusion domain-containing protein [Streptococcus orisratti]|uniref:SEC10/PgrA surface exclusion domain-containing protein n=1 Tax=Streptococcus orisratti TaxID=114652 RepID=UPI003D019DA9